MIGAVDMDFVSDIAQIEADETPEEPPKNMVEAFWRWLVSFAMLSVLASTSDILWPRCEIYLLG